MIKIQEQFNTNSNGDFILSPGEYEGPLVVDRPCTIDGREATLWCDSGPVLVVSSSGVTVKNLRIEVTGNLQDSEDGAAIKTTASDVKLDNVEVRGNVIGLPQEAISCALPSVISLGEFASDEENIFAINIECPSAAKLENRIKDLEVTPGNLSQGNNAICIKTGKLKNNTVLYGEIFIKTAVTRRVYITGKASKNGMLHRETAKIPQTDPVQVPQHTQETNSSHAEEIHSRAVKRGERVALSHTQLLKITYGCASKPKGIDIDGYCFMLAETERVSRDEDLVFFGNAESVDHSVKYRQEEHRNTVEIDMNKISAAG